MRWVMLAIWMGAATAWAGLEPVGTPEAGKARTEHAAGLRAALADLQAAQSAVQTAQAELQDVRTQLDALDPQSVTNWPSARAYLAEDRRLERNLAQSTRAVVTALRNALEVLREVYRTEQAERRAAAARPRPAKGGP